MITLPTEQSPCVTEEELKDDLFKEKVDQCLLNYYEKHLNCKLPWNKKSNISNLCETEEEFDTYWNLAYNMTLEVTESEVYAKTGCKARCRKYIYSHKLIADGNFPYGTVEDTVVLALYFKSGDDINNQI